mmetsp:Transcript_322/g.954  ORF Transcript_322/g.954 Transcript_322/m.954 type:complete len:98 (-) Transcript_322:51-344(-)
MSSGPTAPDQLANEIELVATPIVDDAEYEARITLTLDDTADLSGQVFEDLMSAHFLETEDANDDDDDEEDDDDDDAYAADGNLATHASKRRRTGPLV